MHMMMVLLIFIENAFAKINCENYKDKLVGFCADGASVNIGQRNGVVTKLRDDIPYLIDIHCMAHRLELSIVQMKNKNTLIKKLDDVLHLIWKTYQYSGKSLRELRVVGEEFDARIYAPAQVNGTRWLPHVNRPLKIFIEGRKENLINGSSQYAVIQSHMEHLASS